MCCVVVTVCFKHRWPWPKKQPCCTNSASRDGRILLSSPPMTRIPRHNGSTSSDNNVTTWKPFGFFFLNLVVPWHSGFDALNQNVLKTTTVKSHVDHRWNPMSIRLQLVRFVFYFFPRALKGSQNDFTAIPINQSFLASKHPLLSIMSS